MFEKIKLEKRHQIIRPFDWLNIPPFVIITGPNGSGKTKLLHLLESSISGGAASDGIKFSPIQPKHDGARYKNSMSLISTIAPMNMQVRASTVESLYSSIRDGSWKYSPANAKFIKYIKSHHKKSDEEIQTMSTQQLSGFLPDHFQQYANPNGVLDHQDLSELLFRYHERQIKLHVRLCRENPALTGAALNNLVVTELGEPPWEQINRIFKQYSFNHQILPPESYDIGYVCQFKEIDGDAILSFSELSTGEQLIANVLLWALKKHLNETVETLLLDEPDAHLHPSMLRMFIEIVQDVLVKQFGIQVIMTTHNPTTVALAPDESLFSLSRSSSLRSTSKQDALDILTENIVTVVERTKIVIVEGVTDLRPYYEIMLVIKKLHPDIKMPKLSFRHVKEGGGCQEVIKLARFLDEFGWLVSGIIDNDKTDRDSVPEIVSVLNRYSIENYIYDPIIIFASLLYEGDSVTQDFADKMGISRGEIYEIKNLDAVHLQQIVNFIFTQTFDREISKTSIVKYGERTVSYPNEMIDMKGKELLAHYTNKLSGRRFYPPNCLKILPTVKLIPDELVTIFRKISS